MNASPCEKAITKSAAHSGNMKDPQHAIIDATIEEVILSKFSIVRNFISGILSMGEMFLTPF